MVMWEAPVVCLDRNRSCRGGCNLGPRVCSDAMGLDERIDFRSRIVWESRAIEVSKGEVSSGRIASHLVLLS
jgi:hypothetical protein